jgi:DNA-binding MarR family transcriptional regulator
MSTHRSVTAVPCACTALRKAARAVARVYEAALARAGLTITQFAVLRALQRHGGAAPLSRLAEEMVLERTSLYRTLTPLRRAQLVRFVGTADRRSKAVALTRAGRTRIAEALPHWETAHGAFVDGFGRGRWGETAAVLEEVIRVAQRVG